MKNKYQLYLKDGKLWDLLRAKALLKGIGHHEYIEYLLSEGLRSTRAPGQILNNNDLRDLIVSKMDVGGSIALDLAFETLVQYGCSLRKTKELLKELTKLGVLKQTRDELWQRVV